MKKEFVMRGQTESGEQEILNFSGYKPGYAYRLVEFELYPSSGIGSTSFEACGIINAGKTTDAPTDPNFQDEGTIAVTTHNRSTSPQDGPFYSSVINDTFLITQNLILMVVNSGSGNTPVNWQCRFVAVKMTGPEEAATNFKQFTIFDD